MNRDEFYSSLYLAHHGIKGQKWGVRRYQNEDGSYTEEGAKRRRSDAKSGISDSAKKALKVGAVAAGTALAAIGAYKLHQYMNSPLKSIPTFALKYNKEGNIDALNPLASNWHAKKPTVASASKGIVKSPRLNYVAGEIKEKLNSSKVKDAKQGAMNTIRDAGKAGAAAAITAIGTIAAGKATAHFRDKEGDSEEVRNAKLIGKEATSAAIRRAANSASNKVYTNSSTSGVSNGGGFSSQTLNNLVSEVGKPHQTHSWGEVETMKRYNNIMDAYRTDNDTKQQIRMMKKSGFDIEQIEKKYSK